MERQRSKTGKQLQETTKMFKTAQDEVVGTVKVDGSA
jgi:hypothetical protein